MKRSEFILKLQRELREHRYDFFCTSARSIAQGGDGVIMPGCVKCKESFQTSGQFLEHLVMRIMPEAVERILSQP